MLTLKNINTYTPEYYDLMIPCLYMQTEDGEDWYYHRLRFQAETLKVCYGRDNVIRMANYNAELICPPAGCSVSEVSPDDVPEGFNDMGDWTFDGASIVRRVISDAELTAKAEEIRGELINSARSVINEWQTELALGTISADDKSRLIEWLAYIKSIKAADLTIISDEADLKSFAWPVAPE
ncbi:tail fiber assembly protein [Pantoea anthophila]|uniref:tail fiber assembly protein n=1 Tax=Pantoea anthophila TaxID=470931 RepID=UPI00301E55E8